MDCKDWEVWNSTPEIVTLPPTTETFSKNVKHAHLQTIWKDELISFTTDGHKLWMDKLTKIKVCTANIYMVDIYFL